MYLGCRLGSQGQGVWACLVKSLSSLSTRMGAPIGRGLRTGLLDRTTGQKYWTEMLDRNAGQDCWIGLLDRTTAQSCDCVKVSR